MSFLILVLVGGTLGTWFLRPFHISGIEGYCARLFLGLSFCALLIIVIGSFSLAATQAVFFAIAALCITVEAWRFRQHPKQTAPLQPTQNGSLVPLEILCIGAIVAANALALISALAPNTNWDAGAAHLALPADYTRLGRIALIEGNVYSAYPHLLHALYTFAYYQGGETSAALLSWFYGPLACAAMYTLGNRLAGRPCGLIAAAIFATAPIYFDQVGTVSLDVPAAGTTVMALACLAAWNDDQRRHWLVVAAVLAGSCAGIRHTGYLVIVLLMLGVAFTAKHDRVATIALFAGAALASAAPWMLRTFLTSGNPVYPFGSSLFPTPTLPDVQTTALLTHETAQNAGWRDFLMFPWNIVMRPQWYDGWTKSPGVLVLALGPIGLMVGGTRAWGLGAFSTAGGACFFFFQRLARYFLPFFAPMMVLAAVAVVRLNKFQKPLAVLLAFTFGYGLTLGAAAVHFKAPAALGLQDRQTYLAERVERYPAFVWVNENLPPESIVFTLDPRSYFIKRPAYQNPAVLGILKDMTLDDQLAWLEQRKIEYLFYPVTYVRTSPMFAARGYLPILDAWRIDSDHFEPVQILTLVKPGQDSMERVEIYKIHPRGRSTQ